MARVAEMSGGRWQVTGTDEFQVGGDLSRDRRWGAGKNERLFLQWMATDGGAVGRSRQITIHINGRNRWGRRYSLKV